MNSFFVPQLGSQIYTMAGMTTHLNLMADKAGEFPGFSANFSGDGFSGMRFTVTAMPAGEFDGWVAKARTHGEALDDAGYAALAKPMQATFRPRPSMRSTRGCSSALSTDHTRPGRCGRQRRILFAVETRGGLTCSAG